MEICIFPRSRVSYGLSALGAVRMCRPQLLLLSCCQPEDKIKFEEGLERRGGIWIPVDSP